MEALLDTFNSIILSKTINEYNVQGDRHTVRVRLTLTNGSRLISHESLFYDTSRTKYSYQWMDEVNELIHRWDNAHNVQGIDTSPHHQRHRLRSEENILASEPMTLEKVLTFIASHIGQTIISG